MQPTTIAAQRRAGATIAAILVLLAGCSTYAPTTDPQPRVELPPSFSTGTAGIETGERWWLALDDPALEPLVEKVLAGNLTMRMAWSRLQQMQALARISGSARYPGVEGTLGGEHQRLGIALPPPAGTGADSVDSVTASIGVAYQVDLWQKISSTARAGRFDTAASRQDLDATALTITGAAAELWYAIAAGRATLDLLHEQLTVSQEYLDLVKVRFANGLASAMDVYRQELQVETTRSQVPRTEAALALLTHQLALLQGRHPTAAIDLPPGGLPPLPPLPATGLPAEVLRSRPDVRAAELRLVAADHRLAAAIADRFPSLHLSAAAGGQGTGLSELLDQWFVSLAGNLLAPILDGGRRRAEADRNRTLVEERYAAWEAALLTSCQEVEDALAQEQGLRRSDEILHTQVGLAEATLERSRALYVNGLTDYLNVLTSLQNLQSLQRAAIDVRQELLSNRIRLHLALGGSFSAATAASVAHQRLETDSEDQA